MQTNGFTALLAIVMFVGAVYLAMHLSKKWRKNEYSPETQAAIDEVERRKREAQAQRDADGEG